MFRSLKTILILLIFPAVLILPSSAASADFSFSSTTSATSWDEEDGPDNSSVSEYLKFTSRGTFSGYRLDLEGYGRFTYLEDEFEPNDDAPDRLYVLAITLSGRDGGNVITLGRHFVPALVGPEMIDGLSWQVAAGKATFNTRWGYRSDISGGSESDTVFGFGMDYRLKDSMYFSLDYGRTFDDRLLAELLAAEWVYSWYRYTKAYINFNWDLMSRTLHESLVGTRIFFSDRFSAVFELAHNVQVFESDSIYSVFAVDAAYTRSFSFLFTPSRTTRYAWDYIVESYQGSGSGRRYVVSSHWSPGRTKIYGSLSQHTGFGGDLIEVSASVSTPLFDNLLFTVGGDISSTENDGEDSVTSSLLYAGTELTLTPDMVIDLRLERSNDELTEPTQTGRLSLKMEF